MPPMAQGLLLYRNKNIYLTAGVMRPSWQSMCSRRRCLPAVRSFVLFQQELLSFINAHRVPPDNAVVLHPGSLSLTGLLFLLEGRQPFLHTLHGSAPVLELAALLRRLGCNACWDVDNPHAGLHLIHVLSPFSAAVKPFHAVLPLRCRLLPVRNDAHVHIPVLPLMASAERAPADPQHRTLQAAQVMLCPETDGIKASLPIAFGLRYYIEIAIFFFECCKQLRHRQLAFRRPLSCTNLDYHKFTPHILVPASIQCPESGMELQPAILSICNFC